MTQEAKHTPEAEALADAVLTAAGSGLRHYSMAKTRAAIIAAAQKGINDSQADLLEVLKDVLPYANASIGLPRASWPGDSVILKAEALIAKATGSTKHAASK